MDNKETVDKKETIKNIEVVFDLLEYMSLNPEGIGIREAGRLTDTTKSTIQRIFNTLVEKRIVTLNPLTERYVLDVGIFKIVVRHQSENRLILSSDSILKNLRDQTDETVCLHVLVNDQQLPILQYKSTQELNWHLIVGKTYPVNSGASGKIFLAYMAPAKLDFLMSTFVKVTPNTITDVEDILQSNETIRKERYAVSFGEMSPGAIGMAVPVLDHNGVLVAVVGLYGPEFRMRPKIDEFKEKLLKAAREIEQKLI
ncbi:IclR family transcriptional regulator [Ammoniphilus resinae]|uniref:DNA-binding IclR family transcriptional regulator n=1 Tax=Ammoniphilus resinae TaxID=861532 RepID=A0ABS4GT24_9BACL|nr:IclR family transcriptional regulator [Ammoniphilus resinae]MBP1933282.1 DNA-binding IclR family transcriptional regulator [Ammoniphilus resinae]